MEIKLDSRFQKKVKGIFGKYEFRVGVLNDKPHFLPKPSPTLAGQAKGQKEFKTYAGGPARIQSRIPSGKTVAQISESLRKNLGFNYLTQPFSSPENRDILKFTNAYFSLVFGRGQKKRCENLLQAVVRNPMLRGDYGANSSITQRIKGFDRKTIDTGQLFKSITAECKVVGRV